MKKLKFSDTCFTGANRKAYGCYELSNGYYMDFKFRKVYRNDEPVDMPDSHFDFLARIIASSPEQVSYKELIRLTNGRDGNIDGLRTLKNKMLNAMGNGLENIKIEARNKEAYIIEELPVKIRYYPDVTEAEAKKITRIPAFLRKRRRDDMDDTEKAIDDLSYKFLHGGARALFHEERDAIIYAMEQLSGIFNLITELKYKGEAVSTEPKSVVFEMYEHISKICTETEERNVLKIEGPLGSYKNRIMQYIYLMIKESCEDIMPFYIDLAKYERQVEENGEITEDEFYSHFEKDFYAFSAAISAVGDRVPLLMLDGIRDFKRGNEALYNRISTLIENEDCRIVACVDSDFTMNRKQQFETHPLVPERFEAEAVIRSMNLYDSEAAINFISQCLKVFKDKLKERYKAEDIYNVLVGFDFISIDAYWLISMLKDLMKSGRSIYSIYESFCLSVVKRGALLDKAAEMAYGFEYGSGHCDADVCYDICWRLIRKHRSILEYLIARWYIKRLDMLDINEDSREEFVRKLSFLNMVPQRNVTRFIASELKGNDDYEYKIMYTTTFFYNELPWMSKCELVFWLGRLKDLTRRKESVHLLKEFRENALADYEAGKFDNVARKRDAAFFLRSICISLIYENDEDAFVYYLNSLVNDKTANSVNRGFHLEYYGDKPYIPNKTLLDYEDDVTKGEKALAVLSISLDKKFRNGDSNSFGAILEVMTFCNLIQARMEAAKDDAVPMDVSPYLPDCLFYLKGISCASLIDKIPDVRSYFSWMKRTLENADTVTPHHPSSTYNIFSDAKKVKRTGWVNDNVPEPENIVEHMYNCWLVGMLYLPEKYDEPGYAGYDKNTVLNMLLIHDLGETKTGDIPRGEKDKDRERYDENEREVMHDLLFTGTYPSAVGLSKYLKYWNAWEGKGAKRDINSMVAKDIDTLQTTYQFCRYYLENPGLFSDERVAHWLNDISLMQTKIGKRIMNTLVVRNPEFADVLKNIV